MNSKGSIEFSDNPCASDEKKLIEVRPDYKHKQSSSSGLSLEEKQMLRKIEQREQRREYNRNLERRYPV